MNSKEQNKQNEIRTKKLLIRIINKGGLIGACAKMYINDEEKANQFITECFEQCHNKSAQDFWGEELVMDIVKHYSIQKEKKMNLKTEDKYAYYNDS